MIAYKYAFILGRLLLFYVTCIAYVLKFYLRAMQLFGVSDSEITICDTTPSG